MTPFIRWQIEEAAFSLDAAIRLGKFYGRSHPAVRACLKRAEFFARGAVETTAKWAAKRASTT